MLMNDKSITAITSSKGLALGYPKFYNTTPINQII